MEKHPHLFLGCVGYLLAEPENLEAILNQFPEIFDDEAAFLIHQQVIRYESDPSYWAEHLDVAQRSDWLYRFKLRQTLLPLIQKFGISRAIAFQQHLIQTIPAILLQLIDIDTLHEIKIFLQENEIILQADESVLILDKMLRVHGDEHPVWKQRTLTVKELLLACRSEGLEEAIKRLEGDKIEELVQLLMKFAFAPSWEESRQMVHRHPDLLSPTADTFLNLLIKQAQEKQDQDLFVRLQEHQRILHRCTKEGIDAVFKSAIEETTARVNARLAEESHTTGLESLIEQAQEAHHNQQFPRAIELVIESYELYKKLGIPGAPLLIWIGQIYLEWFDKQPDTQWNILGKALLRLEEAWSILTYNKDTRIAPEKNIRMKYDCASMLVKVYFNQQSDNPEGQYQQVVLWSNRALENAPDQQSVALTQHYLAIGLSHLINYVAPSEVRAMSEKAYELIESALAYFNRAQTPRLYAEGRLLQATMLQLAKDEQLPESHERATHYLKEALLIFAEQGIVHNWYDCHFNLMQVYGSKSLKTDLAAIELAQQHFAAATEVAREEHDDHQWTRFYFKYGSLLIKKNNFPAAAEIYNALLDKSLQSADTKIQGSIHKELCHIYFHWHTSAQSLELASHALRHGEAACELMAGEDVGFTRFYLGLLYSFHSQAHFQENQDRAIEHLSCFIKDFEFDTDSDTRQVLVGAYDALANRLIERATGDIAENLEQAIFFANKGLLIAPSDEFKNSYGNLNNTLAIAYLHRVKGNRSENLEKCIDFAARALNVRTDLNAEHAIAGSMINLANGYMYREEGVKEENYQKSIELLQQSLHLLDPVEDPKNWAGVLNNLGAISGFRKKYEEAAQYYEQVLQVYTRDSFPERWVVTRLNLVSARSNLCDPSDYEPLIDILKENLSVLAPGKDDLERQKQMESMAEMFLQRADYAQAHEWFTEAFKIRDQRLADAYSDVGKRHELGDIGRKFSKDAYCLWRMGDAVAAFRQLELGKNYLLRENLMFLDADLVTEKQDAALLEVIDKLTTLRAEQFLPVSTPGRRSERTMNLLLKETTDHFYALLGHKSPKFNLFEQHQFDLKALIPEGGALVFPMLNPDGLLVFFLTDRYPMPSRENTFQFNQEMVKGLISNLNGEALLPLEASQLPIDQRIDLLCEHLWQVFAGPLYEKLLQLGVRPDSHLIFSPHEFMARLPLAAAWRMENGEKRTLLDDFAVSVCPSLHALYLAHKRIEQLEKIMPSYLGIANPTLDLFFTEKECESVEGLFEKNDWEHRLLKGHHATLRSLQPEIGRHTHIHFACHGTFDKDNPFQSGLLLHGHELFSIKDIYASGFLKNVRLVTLSACETGIIDLKNASESLGLPGALIQSGVPAVVATLWSVDDFSSMLLIERFYLHLVQDKLPPVQALRKAQQWLKALDESSAETHLNRLIPDQKEKIRSSMFKGTENWHSTRPFNLAFYWAGFTCFGF